jgi:hypothetical protein
VAQLHLPPVEMLAHARAAHGGGLRHENGSDRPVR